MAGERPAYRGANASRIAGRGTTRTRRLARAWGFSLAVLVLAGCSSTSDIRLRHPQTGKIVTCSGRSGGEPDRWWDEMAKRVRDSCVKDMQSQGYVIVE